MRTGGGTDFLPMRRLSLAIMLSLCAGAGLAATPEDPEAHYQTLLAAAKATAPNADWGALRLAYAARPSFAAFAQSAAKRSMFEAAEKSDCAAALPAAKAVIEEAYVDIDAHLVAAFCEETAGDTAAAKLDRDIGAGLVASIETGDGLSPASAFTPIDIAEEYAVMRALGVKVIQQGLMQQDGHSYDSFSVTDAKGQPATYYFLIDHVLTAEAAGLKPRDGSVSAAP
jgi:Domain of unknown function (DUF4919)